VHNIGDKLIVLYAIGVIHYNSCY